MKILIILLASALSCYAKVGETPAEIQTRYGSPISGSDGESKIYVFNNCMVVVFFYAGKSCAEEIFPNDDEKQFDDKDCVAMAETIFGHSGWKKSPALEIFTTTWEDSVGNIVSRKRQVLKSDSLAFSSRGFLERTNAKDNKSRSDFVSEFGKPPATNEEIAEQSRRVEPPAIKTLTGNRQIAVLNGEPIHYNETGVIFRRADGTILNRIPYGDFTQEALDKLKSSAKNYEQLNFIKPFILTEEQRSAEIVLNRKLTTELTAAAKEKTDASKVAAAEKALRWNQSQADKGDAFGQFRLAQRYLNGEGVEKDLVQSRAWFSKAAAQGHSEATKELAKLTAPAISEPAAQTHSEHHP